MTQARLRRNDQQDSGDALSLLDACQLAFETYMNDIIKMVGVQKTDWLETGEIKALLEYATPSHASSGLEYLKKPEEYARARVAENLEGIIKEFHAHKPTEYDDNATLAPIPEQDLSSLMALAAEKQAAQAQQEARDRDREDASTEEQYLMDLEDHLKKITSDAATSSAKKNALKFIKTAFEEQYEYFDDKQKQRFWETGEAINAILNDKTTSKFLKKRTELAPN